jgi:hypothetical protein
VVDFRKGGLVEDARGPKLKFILCVAIFISNQLANLNLTNPMWRNPNVLERERNMVVRVAIHTSTVSWPIYFAKHGVASLTSVCVCVDQEAFTLCMLILCARAAAGKFHATRFGYSIPQFVQQSSFTKCFTKRNSPPRHFKTSTTDLDVDRPVAKRSLPEIYELSRSWCLRDNKISSATRENLMTHPLLF